MSSRMDDLEAELLKLPVADRSRLLDCLMASLVVDDETSEAWLNEAVRRDAEVTSGAVAMVPGDVALARIRAGLQ